MPHEKPPLLKNIVLFSFRAIVILFLVIDGIARPLYRPLINYIEAWKITEVLEGFIRKLPRLAVLALFVVPFAIAEPLKVVALIQIAEGKVVRGIILMIFSYLMTFVLVERIYHAGKDKLLTYKWFAWIMGHVTVVREWAAEYKRSTLTAAKDLLRRIGIA